MDGDTELRRGVGEKPSVVPQPPQGGASDGVPSDTTEDDWSRGSGEDPDLEIEHNTTPVQRSITDLDRKVCDLRTVLFDVLITHSSNIIHVLLFPYVQGFH